jgi:hypothetical protein
MPDLVEVGVVLVAVKHAARRLRRWPAAMLERDCARRFTVSGRGEETACFYQTKKHSWQEDKLHLQNFVVAARKRHCHSWAVHIRPCENSLGR